MAMKFNELPMEFQERLNEERKELRGLKCNTPYRIHIYNEDGTRYFYARRVCEAWSDDKGHSMPFGGGTHWNICYGAVQFYRTKNPLGMLDYKWCDGKRFTSKTFEDGSRVEIPSTVSTKKEVLSIIRSLRIFNI
jgi:hypothetical protein